MICHEALTGGCQTAGVEDAVLEDLVVMAACLVVIDTSAEVLLEVRLEVMAEMVETGATGAGVVAAAESPESSPSSPLSESSEVESASSDEVVAVE